MNDAVLAIILLLVGLALLTLEVFIPSAGMIFMSAMCAIGGALWFGWHAWYEQSPGLWWGFLVGVVGCVPLVIVGAFYLIPRTRFGKHILLEAPQAEEVTPFAEENERLNALIGRQGVTQSILNPSGIVDVDGQRLHCESQGMIVAMGQTVEIVGVVGNRLVVSSALTDISQIGDQDVDSVEDGSANASNGSVDFDVPDA